MKTRFAIFCDSSAKAQDAYVRMLRRAGVINRIVKLRKKAKKLQQDCN